MNDLQTTKDNIITLLKLQGVNIPTHYNLDDDYDLLWYLCTYNKIAELKILIDAGIDINVRDMFGSTVLIQTCYYKNKYDVIELLLKSGADPNIKKNNNRAALYFATVFNFHNDFERNVIDLLKEYGATDE